MKLNSKNVKIKMLENDLTVSDFAKRLNTNKCVIYSWLREDNFPVRYIEKIIKVLKVKDINEIIKLNGGGK